MKEKAENTRKAREAKAKAKAEAETVERARAWAEAKAKEKANTTIISADAREKSEDKTRVANIRSR